MVLEQTPPLEDLQSSIENPNTSIGKRMRAAYYLKQLHSRNQHRNDIVNILGTQLFVKDHGSLMRHEFAYVLGQMKDEHACDYLERQLLLENDCVMVRHECAEALGAIGSESSRACLEQCIQQNPDTPELADTARLALNVMDWRKNEHNDEQQQNDFPVACACMLNPYSSIDPAPPHPSHQNMTPQELGAMLANSELPIFDRYRAMFSLRNIGGDACVLELSNVLVEDTSSALLRHEVAYVLGQLQHSASIPFLIQSLQRTDEHVMVRHESAEALGAIPDEWETTIEPILQQYSQDPIPAVAESCLVALDAADYWGTTQNKEDEDDCETAVPPLSFVQQKNASTSTSSSCAAAAPNRSTMNGHFNVKA